MYCTYCSKQNDDTSIYCEFCGKSLKAEPTPLKDMKPANTRTWTRKTASLGSLLILIFFFMPWILVSCSYQMGGALQIEASGYEITTGRYAVIESAAEFGNSIFGPQDYSEDPLFPDPKPLVGLIPIVGLIGLFALNGKPSGAIAAAIGGILGMLGLIAVAISALSFGDEATLYGFDMSFRGGYWGSWIAFIYQAVIGIRTAKR